MSGLLYAAVGTGAAWGQALAVQTVTPTPHSLSAAPTTSISVTFDRAVDPTTITADSFWAMGRWSGPRSGGYSFSNGNQTVTLTPATAFTAGDLVTVILSNQIADTSAVALRSAGYSFQFWTQTQPASLSFSLVADMSTGSPSRPYGGSAALLDADAFLDLAIVNENSDDVRIFINQADGTGSYNAFDPLKTATVGEVPSPSETADFDRDGAIDLAVANVGGNSVSILLGNGNGTFGTHTEYALSLSPTGIVVLDADGDGDLDIATAAGQINLLINDYCNAMGCGNAPVFGTPILVDAPNGGERAIASTDMDNDGILDLVVGQSNTNNVTVCLGDGTPSNFCMSTSTQGAGGKPWMIMTGDLDNDGDADVSSANRFGGQDGGAILKNNGNGTLAAPVLYCDWDMDLCDVQISNPSPVATDHGDLDGDGDLDWTLSRVNDDLAVFTNDGTGTFSLNQVIAPPLGAACSILLDIDNNGRLDMAVIDEFSNLMKVMKNGPVGIQWTLTVATAGTGAGTVTSDPAGITCGSGGTDCDHDYDDETVVDLTATPDAGSVFGSWSGDPDCSDDSVTMDADKSCTATFTNTAPTVTITAPADGSTVTEGTMIDFAGTASDTEDGDLTANLAWSSDLDGAIGTGGAFQATLSVGTHTITASVTDAGGLSGQDQITVTVNAVWTLTVATAGTGAGTVTATGINCGSGGADCTEMYADQTIVTLSKTPDLDSMDDGWSGDPDCSDDSVTIDADKSCTAVFNLFNDLPVENQTLDGTQQIDACISITTGLNLLVIGNIILQAGETVVLGNGLTVEDGAFLQILLDAQICS